MIEMLTLLVGLTVGLQNLDLAVADDVAAVRCELDGRVVATVVSAPWRCAVDLGPEPLPHRVVAVALADNGDELGRAEQWVNLPRDGSELRLVLTGSSGSVPTGARLVWESADGRPPVALGVALDGEPLPVRLDDDGGGASLTWSRLSGDDLHVLSASAEFSGGALARDEAVFGGRYGTEIDTDLTALAIRWTTPREPTLGDFSGRLSLDGRPLRVVAVEKGPAEIFVVRDRALEAVLQDLRVEGGRRPSNRRFGPRFVRDPDVLRFDLQPEPEDRVRFLWPTPDSQAHPRFRQVDIFDVSPVLRAGDGGWFWFLTRLYPSPGRGDGKGAQSLADAVAVAARRVAAGDRRRALVLATSRGQADGSRFGSESVRGYLGALGVPLHLWRPKAKKTREATDPWGQARPIGTVASLRRAVEALQADLDSQRIVWVRGRHLPRQVVATGLPEGVELLARNPSWLSVSDSKSTRRRAFDGR